MYQQKILQTIAKECESTGNGYDSGPVDDLKDELLNELRLLAHKNELTGFNAYIAVTRLITRYSGVFTSDLYEMADNVHRLAFLGKLLRMVEEPFVLTYQQ